jgi:hypothetical protein
MRPDMGDKNKKGANTHVQTRKEDTQAKKNVPRRTAPVTIARTDTSRISIKENPTTPAGSSQQPLLHLLQ